MASVQMTTSADIRGVNAKQIGTVCAPGGDLMRAADAAAQRLKNRFPFMLVDKDAMRNEIMLVFLKKKACRFNADRAKLNTFIDRVVCSIATSFWTKLERQPSPVRTFTDARVVETGLLGREDDTRSTVELSELRSKVNGFLQSLDEVQRAICELFQEGEKKASICRILGLKRSVVERHVKNIGRLFQDAGLAPERRQRTSNRCRRGRRR